MVRERYPGLKIRRTLNGIRISELQKVFRYTRDGKIFRRKNGKRADLHSTSRDRLYVNYGGKNIAASRLIWALTHGWVPDPRGKWVIDHKNHNRMDNSLKNLQMITQQENSVRSLNPYFSKRLLS